MLKPGLLLGESLETGSMARAIEDAMIVQGVIDLDEETPEAAENRRKVFIAIATGVIDHLKSNLEVRVAANKMANNIPLSETLLTGANGDIR